MQSHVPRPRAVGCLASQDRPLRLDLTASTRFEAYSRWLGARRPPTHACMRERRRAKGPGHRARSIDMRWDPSSVYTAKTHGHYHRNLFVFSGLPWPRYVFDQRSIHVLLGVWDSVLHWTMMDERMTTSRMVASGHGVPRRPTQTGLHAYAMYPRLSSCQTTRNVSAAWVGQSRSRPLSHI